MKKKYVVVLREKRDIGTVIALSCSQPPEGFGRWTLCLLADKLVELRVVESISPETVRQTLKKTP